MKRITFRYFDRYCRDGKWRTQTCVVRSLEECMEIDGLGVDCEYEIVSIEEA